jgi:hypothetical protein
MKRRYEGWDGYIRHVRGPDATYGTVYFVGPANGPIKIGFTRDMAKRLSRLQAFSPFPLFVWAAIEGTTLCEAELHRAYSGDRLHGEWFALTPAIAHLIKSKREMSGLRESFSKSAAVIQGLRSLTTGDQSARLIDRSEAA